MRLLKRLFATRNRLRELESHLGIFYDDKDWDEYRDIDGGLLSRYHKRVRRIEKKVLSDKELKEIRYDD